ncbi:MAG: DNA ligase D [Gemmatimonadota bacterium]
MGLEEYWKKRDFEKTPEPSGTGGRTGTGVGTRTGTGTGTRTRTGTRTGTRTRVREGEGGGRRFVVQKHDASHLHYDFRLELEGTLKSWAVPKGPSLKTGVKRLAMQTEDHPLSYGDFEGVIPEGQYGGGTVMVWDRGVWEPEGDPVEDYRRGRLRFRLEGEKLSGSWVLTRMKPKPGEEKSSWLLIKSGDEAAREEDETDITEEKPLSVVTGRDLDAIAADADRVWESDRDGESSGGGAGPESAGSTPSAIPGATRAVMPDTPGAQLARLVGEAPDGDEWVHELKFDGYRILARIEDGEVRLLSRNGKDWTDRFPAVAGSLRELSCDSAVVDGEVVVLDAQGRSRFQLLQNSLSGSRAGEPIFYAFDLLHLDGYDLTGAPLLDRKAQLRPLAATAARQMVRYSDHVRGNGPAFFAQACMMGVEGIISKRADARYRPGRGRDWLKVKCTARQELVIVGYTEPSGSRVGIGALLLGVHDNQGRLVYAGKVGTGFTDRTLRDLEKRLAPMERKTAPVEDPPSGYKARGVHWVTPSLVAEVEFTEWTGDGKVRHPSFQGLREDKDPEAVVRETSGTGTGARTGTRTGTRTGARTGTRTGTRTGARTGTRTGTRVEEREGELRVAGVRVTSPEKVMWEGQGVTKRELVEYYVAMEEAVLPRLVDRPLTLVRCPSGADGDCFYQKHANESVPEVIPRVPVKERKKSELYMYVDGLPSLLALVQLGVLEFHIWGSRRDRLDRPDRLVFDLDPDESLPFGRVAAAALRLREMLAGMGLESWPKSTGGKGLHVVVPITRRNSWDEAREFTQKVARALVQEVPARFTAKVSKSRREGRIFVDYLRNARNSTAIAEYSPRARPGAPVAVPLAWDELNTRARTPAVFTIRDVPDRVAGAGDPWEGFDQVRQSITKAML